MAFTIPDGLHQDLYPLAWLVGTWRGKGQGEYPNTSPFTFEQEVTFNHDGRPFLTYFSRSWLVEDGKGAHPSRTRDRFLASQTK